MRQWDDSSSTMDDSSSSSSSTSQEEDVEHGRSHHLDNHQQQQNQQNNKPSSSLLQKQSSDLQHESRKLAIGTYTGTDTSSSPNRVAMPSSSLYSYPKYPGAPGTPSRRYQFNHDSEDEEDEDDSHRYHLHEQQQSQQKHSYYPEPEMVDVTYEEKYGEAYVNKPLRYLYPSGYGNMRPRSRPWQLSVVICTAFAWLNVFIVGHCSDRFDWDNYNFDDANGNNNNNNNNNNGEDIDEGQWEEYYQAGQYDFDDDAMMIETRWCGSRPLYFMWVLSVMITGLSCAYCSIVGYIKARDFSVANNRSQLPGMVGKSDYYVKIEEELNCKGNRRFSSEKMNYMMDNDSFGESSYHPRSYQGGRNCMNSKGKKKKKNWFRETMYQADGTPRYFGGRIYRPTQAAVNITSR